MTNRQGVNKKHHLTPLRPECVWFPWFISTNSQIIMTQMERKINVDLMKSPPTNSTT